MHELGEQQLPGLRYAARVSALKRLEWVGKVLLAWLVAALTFRPGRRKHSGARLRAAKRVLLVRPDNRVGEALLTTPLCEALAQAGLEVHVLAHTKMVRVLDGLPSIRRVWAFDERRRWLGPWNASIRALRAERFDAVINCGNWEAASATSAILSRLCAPAGVVIGPANIPSGWLMDVPVQALANEESELVQRAHLASPLTTIATPRMAFRAPRVDENFSTFVDGLGAFAVVNPGGRLQERRVPTTVFAAACEALTKRGLVPLVTWGPGEEALRDELCKLAPSAQAAPPTSLDELAALMARARMTVCNNTGPMHLAVAVKSPTLALFFVMSVERWGHLYAPHQMLDVTNAVAQGTAEAVVTQAIAGFNAR